jgi:outer membrane protein OmpA-like peptidoglycan-associated protein
VTVYFANGSTTIGAQYKPQLLQLAQQAKGIKAYVLQVKGYASAVGSVALNQKLSSERAANVTEFLEQQGNIPLTNMLGLRPSRDVSPEALME